MEASSHGTRSNEIGNETLSNNFTGGLSDEDMNDIRSHTMSWLYLDCATMAPTSDHSRKLSNGNFSPEDHSFPPFIKGKLVQLVLQQIVRDFPMRWSGAFQDMISLMISSNSSKTSVEYVCDMLNALYDEVISQEYPRTVQEVEIATRIKDGMRERAVNDIMQGLLQVVNNLMNSVPDVAKKCLQSLAMHVSWFPLELSLRAVPTVCSFLQSAKKEYNHHLATGSYSFIQAVMMKSMTLDGKYEILCEKLDVVNILSASEIDSQGSNHDGDARACFVSAACSETLSCLRRHIIEARKDYHGVTRVQKLQNLLDILLKRFFVNQLNARGCSLAITSCMSFVSEYISFIRKLENNPLYSNHLAIISSLLERLCDCSILSDDIIEEGATVYDELFDDNIYEIRNEVLVNFRNLARIVPNQCSSLVTQKLQTVIKRVNDNGIESCRSIPADVENCLILLHELAEGAQQQYALAKYGCLYQPAILSIQGMTISLSKCLDNPIISLAFMEICVRYNRIFLNQKEISTAKSRNQAQIQEEVVYPVVEVSGVLDHFFGRNGVCHNSLNLRSRASYLLLRLVRSIRQRLQQYRHQLVSSLFAPIRYSFRDGIDTYYRYTSTKLESTGMETSEVKMHIFEATGIILGGSPDNSIFTLEEQLEILSSLRECIKSCANDELSRHKGGVANDSNIENGCAAIICATLNASGHLFSGLSEGLKEAGKSQFCKLFEEIFQFVFPYFELHEAVPILHGCICTFIHRSVSSFGEAAVSYAVPVLPLLLSAPLAKQSNVMMLVCQLIVELKQSSKVLVESFLPYVLRNVSVLLDTTKFAVDGRTMSQDLVTIEEDREFMEVQRSFYQLLQTALCHVPNVFLCDELRPNLERLLHLLVICATMHPSPACKKMCISALAQLALAYEKAENDTSSFRSIEGLPQFLVERVGGDAGLKFIFSGKLDLKDAEVINTFSDIAICQVILARTFQTDYAEFVSRIMLSYDFSAEQLNSFLSTLSRLNSFETKKALRTLALHKFDQRKGNP